jgi:hypothetical protein
MTKILIPASQILFGSVDGQGALESAIGFTFDPTTYSFFAKVGDTGSFFAQDALQHNGIQIVGGAAGYLQLFGKQAVEIIGIAGCTIEFAVGGKYSFRINDGGISFWNAPTIQKPSVTGSRASGAALASLLTALAAYGLITDNTTP